MSRPPREAAIHGFVFREATLEDRAILLAWRNDELTRRASFSTEPVAPEEHAEWLRRTVTDRDRHLYLALERGKEVGTVRLDVDGSLRELSWTVAPCARGHGVGTRMVQAAVRLFGPPLSARVKAVNEPSRRICQRAGFALDYVTDDTECWRLQPAAARSV